MARFSQVLHLVPSLLLGLLAGTDGCGPARNPVLQLPVTPTPLVLKGRVSADSGNPIPARLTLIRLTQKHRNDTIGTVNLPSDGRFRFDNLAAGTYELNARSIGYHRRRDTLLLSSPPGLEVSLELRPASMCLDLCPPDPALVEAARLQQWRWQCDRETSSVASARAQWAAFLADSALRRYLVHQLDSMTIAGQLQRIRDDAICRRLAIALFPKATSLAFTLFRWSHYWLLSDPGFGAAIVANDSLRPVAGIYGGSFAVWIPRP